jgi:hypothetical protein
MVTNSAEGFLHSRGIAVLMDASARRMVPSSTGDVNALGELKDLHLTTDMPTANTPGALLHRCHLISHTSETIVAIHPTYGAFNLYRD